MAAKNAKRREEGTGEGRRNRTAGLVRCVATLLGAQKFSGLRVVVYSPARPTAFLCERS